MLHHTLRGLRPLAAAALSVAAFAQSPPTVGNVFVVRVGDGVAALSPASTATFVDEYTPAGVLVQSIAMPAAASGTNQPLTNSGTATSEGFLNVSTNGFYLTLVGYGTAPGLPAVAATAATAVPRVVGRIDLFGAIDTSTALTDAYGTSPVSAAAANPRAAASDDGQRFWLSGVGSGTTGGVRFVASVGSTTSVPLHAGQLANTRVVGLYNGQLYTSSSSGQFQGVSAVGTGLPTNGTNTVVPLNGFPIAAGPSAYDYFFADPNTLYVADDRTNGSGGVQKWTQSAGLWTLQYTLAPGPTSGCRGVTGFVQGGVTMLWATANTGSATQLVTGVDAGPTSTLTAIATAAPNTAFRGVRYLGKPTTLQRITAACGATDIVATGNAQIGTDVITTVLNPVGFGFVGYGLTQFMFPFCNCTVVHDFSLLVLGPSHTLSLPNNPTLIGIQLFVQGLDFLAPGGCPDPLFTLTDGYSLVVQ